MKFNIFNYTITIKKKKQRKKKLEKSKVWTPPSSLDAPSPPRGYVHRWVRAEAIAFSNRKTKPKIRKGYELVKAKKGYPEIEEGRLKGHIGIGGLILVKIPISIFKGERYE